VSLLISNSCDAMPIDAIIEALLFYRADPIPKAELVKMLGVSEEAVSEGLEVLKGKLADHGVRLLDDEERVALVTAPEAAQMIEKVRMDELSNEIGKAGLETLSIILYRAPVGRSTIDYIRGVNSQSILRTLAIRGLIEKTSATKSRSALYKPTLELLAHLGLTKVEELPNYRERKAEIARFEETIP
jgi:segregation and condensation protein B